MISSLRNRFPDVYYLSIHDSEIVVVTMEQLRQCCSKERRYLFVVSEIVILQCRSSSILPDLLDRFTLLEL